MTEEEMIALIAAGDAALREVWGEVIAYLRERNQLADVETALARGDYEGAIQGLQEAGSRLAEEWVRQFTEAARAEARSVTGATSRLVSYGGTNPSAVAALDRVRLDLIAGISSEARDLVRSVVSRGLAIGQNPREMARQIVDSLGLTPEMEQYVANYRAQLEAGQLAAAQSRALADGRYSTSRQPSQAQIDAMVGNYRDAWLQHRAETVARTEALAAANMGVAELFDQAYASGQLDPTEIEEEWRSALKLSTRDSHRAMHGQTRSPGDPFVSGAGYELRFPGDPDAPASERVHCLCVVLRRMVRLGDVARLL